jgi:hypothetical protein
MTPQKAAIEALEQMILEVRHAQSVGSSWYTKGDSGLYQQVRMWLDKGSKSLTTLRENQGCAVVTWQQIETAPKNKTILLGFFNYLGNWRSVHGAWLDELYDEFEEIREGVEGWYETSVTADDIPNVWSIIPTHWMPLPTPPEKKETP